MPRGRLINILYATFQRLDQSTTAYDLAYQEPETSRSELPPIELPVQVEDPTWFRGQFNYTGVEQAGELSLIIHYSDLELLSLLDSSRKPLINIGARLTQLRRDSGEVVQSFPNPPGMFVIQAHDSSFGLSVDNNPTRNLLFLLLAPRRRSIT